jgi:hypothetical protein
MTMAGDAARWLGCAGTFLALSASMLAIVPAAADEASTACAPPTLECEKSLPVDLEVCFQQFLAMDDAEPCAWDAFVQQAGDAKRLFFNQETGTLRLHPPDAPPPPKQFEYSLPPGVTQQSTEGALLMSTRHLVDVAYLPSGGYVSWLTLTPWVRGHRDVTYDVLRNEFKFYAAAWEQAMDGSWEPDIYGWTDDAQHAQTPLDEDALQIKPSSDYPDGKEARTKFVSKVVEIVQRVRSQCGTKPEVALYWLGYALHGVQDLAAHKGRSYAEHAWNSYCSNANCDSGPRSECDHATSQAPCKEKDPDDNIENYELAKRFSVQLLRTVSEALGESCWEKLRTYNGRKLTNIEKKSDLKLERDLTKTEYDKYKQSAVRFAALPPAQRQIVRWFGATSGDEEPLFSAIKERLGK